MSIPIQITDELACNEIKTRVLKNKESFRELEQVVVKKRRLKDAIHAARYAVKHPSSIYYSEILENYFLELGRSMEDDTKWDSIG